MNSEKGTGQSALNRFVSIGTEKMATTKEPMRLRQPIQCEQTYLLTGLLPIQLNPIGETIL